MLTFRSIARTIAVPGTLTALLSVPGALWAGDAAPSMRMESLNWLSGVWRTRNGDDEVEEVYGPVTGAELLSTFKASSHGTVSRYELRRYYQDGDRVVVQEIAFGPKLSSVPAVADRVLISEDSTHLQFTGVSIERIGPDRMDVTVTLTEGATDVSRQVTMHYRRVFHLS